MPNTYDNVKLDFLFIADHILAFPSHNNMVSEVKNLYLNFKQIAWRCIASLDIFIWIVKSILSLNSKQFHQKLYSNRLYGVDITCHSL